MARKILPIDILAARTAATIKFNNLLAELVNNDAPASEIQNALERNRKDLEYIDGLHYEATPIPMPARW